MVLIAKEWVWVKSLSHTYVCDVPVEQRFEEVDETEVLLVLFVLDKLDREQKPANGEVSLYDGVPIDQNHCDEAIVVL